MISRQTCFGRSICSYFNTVQPPGFGVVDIFRLFSMCLSASMTLRIWRSLHHNNGTTSSRFPSFFTRGGSNSSFMHPLKLFFFIKNHFSLFSKGRHLTSQAHRGEGILVTGNTFFLACCACCHPGLACKSLFVLHIEPSEQQTSLL